MLYVIIVTYNGMKWLSTCLSSLQGSSVEHSVFVVDNNSVDRTISFVRKEFPDVRILQNSSNLGFGQANNIGMKCALQHDADAFFLLNQDVYVNPDSIEKLLITRDNYPEYGIISPLHLNGAGTGLDSGFFGHLKRCDCEIIQDSILARQKEIYSVPFVNAAAWLITRACMNAVGGFDPLFHHYGEDDNYCQRAAFHGFKIGVTPFSTIRHDREDRRGHSSLAVERGERRKRIVVRLCDVKIPSSARIRMLAKIVLGSLFRAGKRSLSGDFGSASVFFDASIFAMRMFKKSTMHYHINRNRGQNWLEEQSAW
jgi:GT2 family glycosyltransferase